MEMQYRLVTHVYLLCQVSNYRKHASIFFASLALKQMFNHTFSVLAIYKCTQESPNQHTRNTHE